MIRLDAFRVLDEAPDVLALAFRSLRLPLEQVLEGGLRSVRVAPQERRPARRWRRRRRSYRGAFATPGGPHLPIGRHAIRTPAGVVHRFDGLLVGTRLASLTRYVRERCLFEPDTVLADLGSDLEGLDERLSASLENAVQRDGWQESAPWETGRETATLPGIRYEVTGATVAGLREVHHRGATWMVAGGWGQVEVQARRTLSFGAHRVPIRVRLVYNPHDGCDVAWFDGRRVGLAASTADLPGRLIEELRRRGRAMPESGAPITPLADLSPVFLLRVPTHRERSRLGGGGDSQVPVAARRPAVLLPTDGCVALQDGRGEPLDLPVISRPADAMAVLSRRAGDDAYVPGVDPMHWEDVRVEPGVRWLVGVSPLELSA